MPKANNRYLSRYAKTKTQFDRTDPWPDIPFADDDVAPHALLRSALAFVGIVLVVVVLAYLPELVNAVRS